MYLEFSSITIENFKTFVGKPQTLHLTDKNPGLRFIRGRNDAEPDLGSNGSGKSSLLDALSWCLFGHTVDDLRNPDVEPWVGEGYPNVTTIIFIDNRRHSIKRTTHPNKLLLDGKETGQHEIEQLLGFDFEVFKHTVVFGQGQPLFFDLGPKEKMEIFSSALNLNRWEARSDIAGEKTRALAGELTTLKSSLLAAEATLTQAEGLLKQSQASATVWDEERKGQTKEQQKQLTKLASQLPKLKEQQATADLALDSAGTELKALDNNIAKLTDARDDAQNEYNKVELLLDGLQDVIHALTKELGAKTDTCPTCGQSLKGTALAQHKAELQERIQTLQAKVKVGVPRKVALALDNAVSALDKAKSNARTFREKADAAQTTLNVVTPSVIRLETQIRELQKQQKERGSEGNPHREQIQILRRKVSALTTQLDNLDHDILVVEKEQLRTAFWVKGFKDVRLHMLEEMLQELEMATNALLPESGLQNWAVRYSIEKETKKGTTIHGLNVVILSPNNTKPVKWASWSGGEKHRLRVVGALALAEVLLSHAGVRTNLEALDEPTMGLSKEGVSDLVEFLADRAKQQNKDVFFIDHHAIESSRFSTTILVVKDTNGSYIE